MYLIDTNVISELRRSRPHGAVVAWISETPNEQLQISAVTLGELQAGVEALRTRDPDRAGAIESWIDDMAASWNVVPVDGSSFRVLAKIMRGHPQEDWQDAMIAATALVHALTVVTRNVRDFEPFGVPTLDPFATDKR